MEARRDPVRVDSEVVPAKVSVLLELAHRVPQALLGYLCGGEHVVAFDLHVAVPCF
jgi:hypothetical protein